jgi:membrane protease YdiL (CAAX protease family)
MQSKARVCPDFSASGGPLVSAESTESKPEARMRHPWLCVLALMAWQVALSVLLRTLHSFWRTGDIAGQLLVQDFSKVVMAFGFLAITYTFSQTGSLSEFARFVRLNRWPSLAGWALACCALALSLVDRAGVVHGWTSPNRTAKTFFEHGGAPLSLYILLALSLGPFFEEVAMRGFLYKVFRIAYGRTLAIILLLGIGSYFHWTAVSGSLFTLACLFSLWALLCLVQEKTRNVWNCILCHSAFNATAALGWQSSALGLLLALVLILLGRYRHLLGRKGGSH